MNDLIKDIKKKDKQAIALLYNRYGKKLYGYAVKRWSVSEDDAWELIYKTIYKIISVIDKYTFETEEKFGAFVFQVFINYLRNHYKAAKRDSVETVDFNDTHASSAHDKQHEIQEPANESAYMKCLKKAMDQLEDWKRILLLMKAQDFSYADISNYVGKPPEQLKVYHLRAKQVITHKVNECLENHEDA